MSKQPCNNCPFRVEVDMCLRPGRVKQIVKSLYHDCDFPCHKTVRYGDDDGEGRVTGESKRCIGAALFLEKTVQGELLANLSFRLAVMMGEFTPEELDRTVEVWDSLEEFVEGQL